MLLCMLCSCTEGGNDLKVEVSSSNKSLIELATRIYDETELSEIVKFNGSIDELNAQYPIECLRNIGNTYRVSYLGNNSVAIVLFNVSGERLYGNIYSIQQMKSDFSGLVKGQSLEKVKEIDPNGEYLFLYTGRNDTPKISSHYTKDGYLISIEYDAFNTIVNIDSELI